MVSYALRRLVAALPTLLGVTIIVFLVVRVLPGDPGRAIAGVLASQHDVEVIRNSMGLDRPLHEQYSDFIVRILRGDLGTSARTGQPVLHEITARLPATVQLAVLATVVASLVGIVAGTISAMRPNSLLDFIISAVAVFGMSMPVYWLGLMLIILFSVELQVLPSAGNAEPLAFVLPTLTLAAFSVALVARMARSSILEALSQDYIRTARAKGASRLRATIRHALPNASLPIVTVIGLQFGALLGGAVITETIFSWPGLGQLLIQSISARDYPVVQGLLLVFGASVILVNLIVDLTYAYLDPRVDLR
jgi:ABC-type dipeptide/oligopeptide/nickel transport system permease component